MVRRRCCGGGGFLRGAKPYIAIILLQLGYAGMGIITKKSLNGGMSHYVLVVYRHAFATLSIAPFALILEREQRPRMTFGIFVQIFVLAMLGPVIDQNFFYAAMKMTSPTFVWAMSNTLPAMTFVMAALCRMEKVDLGKRRCQAKVAGTVVSVAGAMLMTLYKGPVAEMFWYKEDHGGAPAAAPAPAASAPGGSADNMDPVKGSAFALIGTVAWAAFFVVQTVTQARYPAKLSLVAMICLVGTLQAVAVTFAMERRRPSASWSIGFDMNLLAAAYSGIVTSGIAYYVQGLVIQTRGPVFATAFSPLLIIFSAVLGSFLLSENIYLGGVVGAVLIAAGLCSVLWGKYKEEEEEGERGSRAGTVPPGPTKGVAGGGTKTSAEPDDAGPQRPESGEDARRKCRRIPVDVEAAEAPGKDGDPNV